MTDPISGLATDLLAYADGFKWFVLELAIFMLLDHIPYRKP